MNDMGPVPVECPCCRSENTTRQVTETDFECSWCGHEWVEPPVEDGVDSSPCESPEDADSFESATDEG